MDIIIDDTLDGELTGNDISFIINFERHFNELWNSKESAKDWLNRLSCRTDICDDDKWELESEPLDRKIYEIVAIRDIMKKHGLII